MPVLYARQELTGADRQHAHNYEQGDVVRYTKGSKPLGIEAEEYAPVQRVDTESNTLTITRKSGEELSYDPRRLQGVTVYRDGERIFAQGDRVQMTAPYNEQKLANRELGTVEKIDVSGNLKLRMDSGRAVEFNVRQMPHLGYGYAVTSYSSQGQTADRVLDQVDSAETRGELLNKERDTESGNDYFGARYYASSMRRWVSPDPGWFLAAHLSNPQSWNMYAYVLNDLLGYVDRPITGSSSPMRRATLHDNQTIMPRFADKPRRFGLTIQIHTRRPTRRRGRRRCGSDAAYTPVVPRSSVYPFIRPLLTSHQPRPATAPEIGFCLVISTSS